MPGQYKRTHLRVVGLSEPVGQLPCITYIHITFIYNLVYMLSTSSKKLLVLYTTDRTMYSPVISGRSEKSEDIQ